jgi:hypothetical protein
MAELEKHPHRWSGGEEDEVAEYQALSASAAISVILGLAGGVLAFVDPTLWVLPWAGGAAALVALWRIARYAPALTGRRVALVGLGLSLAFGVAAPTEFLFTRWLVRRQARQFAMQWFDYLQNGEPHKAHQLKRFPDPTIRQPLDENLWQFYRENPGQNRELRNFVSRSRPWVRALIHMGKDAQVRYYTTEQQQRQGENFELHQVYAVTYQDEGQTRTFFVWLRLRRVWVDRTGSPGWQIVQDAGGYRPEALADPTQPDAEDA